MSGLSAMAALCLYAAATARPGNGQCSMCDRVGRVRSVVAIPEYWDPFTERRYPPSILMFHLCRWHAGHAEVAG